MNWNTYRFGDAVLFPPEIKLRKGDDYPFIEMDVVQRDHRYVSSSALRRYDSSSFSKFAYQDVLLARITPCLENGKIAQVRMAPTEQGFGSTEFFVFRAKPQVLDPSFLFYLSKSDLIWKSAVNSMVGASGRQRADAAFLKRQLVRLPAIPTQRKIAAVLAAYDDLIEANRRRIALLERMAEELYREWFVRLRFPGHAKTKITKGLPAGWEIRPFSAVVAIDPVERIDKEEERPFAAMDDLSESSMYFTPSERRRGNVGPKFRNGDVLFPRITPSVENGKRGLALTLAEGEVAQGSTEFIVMREKVITTEHIYFLSCSEGFRTNAELSMTGASGRQRVQDQCFDNFLVKVPPETLRQRFTEVVRPMVEQIRVLCRKSEHLQRTRDLLLPRLISGKLPVEDLAIAFPPSMIESQVAKPA